jgi:phage terminase large subunit-like protein
VATGKKVALPVDPVKRYAEEVVSGARVAGPHIRASCARHMRDLKDGYERGLKWDVEKSLKAIRFFENVLKLNGGRFEGKPFLLLPWQKFIVGSLFGWMGQDGTRRFRSAYVETAKGPLALDTPVATTTGWTTMAKIEPGDHVFDEAGRPTLVTAVSPVFHDRECYRLTFSDGAEIVADAEHRWNTAALRSGMKPGPRNDAIRKGGYAKRNTSEIALSLRAPQSASDHPQAKWNHRVDVASALELPDSDLPIPPYTLGAWLGDGDSDCARITSADEEIMASIEADGFTLGKRQGKPGSVAWRQSIGGRDRKTCSRGHGVVDRSKTGRCLACERETDHARRGGDPASTPIQFSLNQTLRNCNLLLNKHIPREYFRAGTAQRLALLQGLMDTDGTVAIGGKCELTLCREVLARDALELLRGLGFKATLKESDAVLNGRIVGFRWRIGFQAYRSFPPFRLTRKTDRLGVEPVTRALSRGRMIVGCERIDSVPVRCITVESESHMFLAGKHLVPTCNSGKSPLSAGIGMLGLVADGEARAEIYAAATKRDQAMILFRDAVAMVTQSPELTKRLVKSGTGEKVWNLAYVQTGSFFRPISSDDGQSGPRPHIALIDEVHEHKNNFVVEMMRAGTKSRAQAMIFMITNSGSNKLGPCWAYHEYGSRVAVGEVEDDAFFSFVCSLDPEDDPFKSEECWFKSNPSLQDADLPGLKYLREQVTEARGMPSKEAMVRRLNFCQWTDAENPWISADIWKSAMVEFDWRDLRGRRAWAGLDLSSTTDLTALVFLVEPVEPGEAWKIVPFCWLPDADLQRKQEVDKVPYLTWVSRGFLETTPGRAVSKRIVLQRLSAMCDFFDVVDCAYDRWRIEDLLSMASDDGISLPPMSPFGQGYKDMSPALETFERMLLNNELTHNGHPVLTWCANNAVTVGDDAENRKLSKEKAIGRIDLMVAAVMAAGRLNVSSETTIFGEDYEMVMV